MNQRRFQPEKIPQLRAHSVGCEKFLLPFDRPLDVEIGCGAGLHPIKYAKLNPERLLVAIEHTKQRFDLFSGRLKNHAELASRIHPVHADAISWITHQLPEKAVDRYFLLYPNPYPKKSDLNKRWYAMPFMERLIWTMKPGATLTLATNEEFYFREAQEYFIKTWKFTEISSPFSVEPDYFPRTHFEKKYTKRGAKVWNGNFQI